MSKTTPLTVGLLWHSANSDNLGVGALTLSQIAILRQISANTGRPLQIMILGWKDPRPSYAVGDDITLANFRTRDLVTSGFAARVRKCDLVLDIGAGDSFSDIYGGKRFIKYMLAKFTVLLLGRPLVLSPQTLGPFQAGWARKLAFASLKRSRAVFARDQKSIDILRGEGFSGAIELASDVAFRLPYDTPAPRAEGGPLKVGLNLSGLLMNGGYSGGNEFGLKANYPALIRDIAAHFSAMDGVELHLVAHVISDAFVVEDDYRACAALAKEFPGAVVAPKFTSPSEAKSYIAGLDFFMGARMHACIAAFSSGVPVVPMAYSRKFAGLFGALGYDYTVDCTAQSNEEIISAIQTGFDTRDTLASDAKAAFGRGVERLSNYETLLKELIETR